MLENENHIIGRYVSFSIIFINILYGVFLGNGESMFLMNNNNLIWIMYSVILIFIYEAPVHFNHTSHSDSDVSGGESANTSPGYFDSDSGIRMTPS